MSRQPPQTPWVGLPRFQDESLLIDVQPIFDVSLGEDMGNDSIGWADDKPSVIETKKGNTPVDTSLDLGDYLPEEETRYDISDVEQARTADNTNLNAEVPPYKPIVSHTHKREGSQSLIPVAGPYKKTKPPREKKDDDLYNRRLSDSLRRSSSGNLNDLYISQTYSHIPRLVQPSSSKLPVPPKIAKLPKNTASSRLKAGLQNQLKQHDMDGCTIDRGRILNDNDTTSRIQENSGEQQTSALSRYLAKSDVLIPRSIIHTSNETAAEAKQQNRLPLNTSACVAASSIVQNMDTVNEIPHEASASIRHDSPFSLSSSVSEALSSHTQKSSVNYDGVDEAGLSRSRRSSMSDKVVDFFSNLLNRSTSSSSLRNEEVSINDQEDDPEDTVRFEEYEELYKSEIQLGQERSKIEAATQEQVQVNQSNKLNRGTNTVKNVQRMRGLTKPIPFSRSLHIRSDRNIRDKSSSSVSTNVKSKSIALQPTTKSNIQSSSSSSSSSSSIKKGIDRPLSIKPSTFASKAISKLPPPGKGHLISNSSQPISIKSIERVKNLNERKNVFERLSSNNSTKNNNSLFEEKGKGKLIEKTNLNLNLNLTIPLKGHTPGKLSNLRSIERNKFNELIEKNQKQKEFLIYDKNLKKQIEDDLIYLNSRKQTVIWAKPIPAMYKK
ncbi:uncharacterized protein I206_105923 [Kwoniella pini CBS 10737]|uniref:TPX2 C-terminal domain-containing protein n=1 Tax=Kwoniella pini CBS 10737 TaxID=1296096 RepID=A0A1B9I0J5_9TREE|nr:uncharacterized protein I206_04746 [Kwoniella pini CBS 10737]OCF49059.1 hypothetical protein I206_04746 [Kwoniella pini CBS 10737]